MLINMICGKCGGEKAESAFYKADGYCKQCRLEYNRAWRKANPERQKKLIKDWKENNPDRVREMMRRKQEKKKLKMESDPEYRELELEKKRVAARRKYRRKREQMGYSTLKDGNVDDRARKRSFKATLRLELLHKQRFRCANCKKFLFDGHHVDHIVPRAKGGTNDKPNLQLLCPKCNREKSCLDPIEHAQQNGRLL